MSKKWEIFHEQALQLQGEANALASRIAARKGSGLYRYRFAAAYSPALCPDCISDVLAANRTCSWNTGILLHGSAGRRNSIATLAIRFRIAATRIELEGDRI